MIPRIRELKPKENFILEVTFDDGYQVVYDVLEDIRTIESYAILEQIPGMFEQVQLDSSRTCVYWSDEIDLPSDTIYEYGKAMKDTFSAE